MSNGELIPHLFRTEYRKIVSVLCRHVGIDQIEAAEDIASDTFFTAAQSWALKGIPDNPVAWLYNVAKNKARNYLQRENVFHNKIAPELKSTNHQAEEKELDLSPQNIADSQLQMMFVVCHPSIPTEAQVGLALRILCGFGIEEIADAFLSSKDTINKRLTRAKEKLREEKIQLMAIDVARIDRESKDERLAAVLTTLYLLFNEGYYSASQNNVLRKDLCFEAMRLCTMLIENTDTNTPAVNALMSLMCFHASRFEARVSSSGEIILYEEQDKTRWNWDLISKGGYFLRCAAVGDKISRYHLEAGIAYWHTTDDTNEKWESILDLYNRLLQHSYSPVAALNRTYALSRARGKMEAIAEAEKLDLRDNHFYLSLLGELYSEIDNEKARTYLNQALISAKTDADKKILLKRIHALTQR